MRVITNRESRISVHWIKTSLKENIDIKHGYAFKGEYFTDNENNNVLLTPGNFNIGGGFKSDKFKFYNGEVLDEYVLSESDIIVTMTDLSKNGDTLGYSAKVPKINNKRLLHNQRLGKIIFKQNSQIDREFLYWLLRTREYRHHILATASGTSVKHTSPSRILDYSFYCPSLQEQRAIASILGSLDDKLALNRQMNSTLEAIGQAIFKHWFVDFEFPNEEGKPYRSSGGEMVETELGEVPKGWKAKPIDQAADFLNGLAMQKYPPKGEDYLPVIKIRELKQCTTESSDKASPEIDKKFIVNDGDILFSWSGSLEVCIWCGGTGALNQHLFKVTSQNYPKWFYYQWIKVYLPEFQHIAEGKATTMGHIQRYHLSNSLVVAPPNEIIEKANKLMNPLIERYINNAVESRNLSKIRDALLPKLMSGQIRVPVEVRA